MGKSFNLAKVFLLCSFLLFLVDSSGAFAAKTPKYMGYKKCKGCHSKEYGSWKEGAMGTVSFRALMPGVSADAKTEAGLDPQQDFTTDPKCLECHGTGYGEPGGYVDPITTPYLAGVTCEACHGPGEYYWRVMAKKRKVFTTYELSALKFVRPNQKTCDKCHKPGCPTVDADSASMDFDRAAAHDNFELKYQH